RARAIERLVDVGHLERHVVRAGAARGEEAVQEAAGRAIGSDDLDRAAAREFPLPEYESGAGARSALAAAEVASQELRDRRDIAYAERDVIELGRCHGAQR